MSNSEVTVRSRRHLWSRHERLILLSLAALGVVYGDIGTSPLYAIRECFSPSHGMAPTQANILGLLSLVFWPLVLIISLKYVLYVMRADNQGEGGVLALMTLLHGRGRRDGRFLSAAVLVVGLFGAALLYGDGIITPAISVLSAVEGLKIATPYFEHHDQMVVWISILILIGLFMFQRKGTGMVGAIFGPVILLWFSVIGLLGFGSIVQTPEILAAVNPLHAVDFFREHGKAGFFILSAVFLVITGGEALYADMGHFGRKPIQITWFAVVLPALLLNYFGQGALLMRDPEAVVNPFYLLAPRWFLYPMVAISTMAAVIASQAVISGAYSITKQAIALGYLPRLQIVHTSEREEGQIYIPSINMMLMIATLWLVFEFKSSSGLAAAYGIAVSGTMVITTMLAFLVSWKVWNWRGSVAVAVSLIFFFVDAAFLTANFAKFLDGGYIPIALGAAIFAVATTWRRGRELLATRIREVGRSLDDFLAVVRKKSLVRVPRTAVYMTATRDIVPQALTLNTVTNSVLHERVILLSVIFVEAPFVRRISRLKIQDLGQGVYRIFIHYGFMETPNVPRALELLPENGMNVAISDMIFFMGNETVIASVVPAGMAIWREKLFAFLSRNARKAPAYFQIPSKQVVEIGTQIEL